MNDLPVKQEWTQSYGVDLKLFTPLDNSVVLSHGVKV